MTSLIFIDLHEVYYFIDAGLWFYIYNQLFCFYNACVSINTFSGRKPVRHFDQFLSAHQKKDRKSVV